MRGPPVHVQRNVREGNVRDPSLCRETDRRVVCWCLLEVLGGRQCTSVHRQLPNEPGAKAHGGFAVFPQQEFWLLFERPRGDAMSAIAVPSGTQCAFVDLMCFRSARVYTGGKKRLQLFSPAELAGKHRKTETITIVLDTSRLKHRNFFCRTAAMRTRGPNFPERSPRFFSMWMHVMSSVFGSSSVFVPGVSPTGRAMST